MRSLLRPLVAAVAVLALAPAALASDVTDIARDLKMPEAVVASSVAQIDSFYQSPQGPANRLSSGVVKELVLKALRDKLSRLEGSTPGKVSDSSASDGGATFKIQVKTTRHDISEQSDCVENRVNVLVSEAVPVVKDGGFVLDNAHPRESRTEWPMTFCRHLGGNGEYGAWGLTQ